MRLVPFNSPRAAAPTPDDRLLPIIGIINHLAHVEWRWIDGRYLCHEFPPKHVLLGLEEPLDLRWAVLHLIEETARHAGHADVIRELLDGTKSYY